MMHHMNATASQSTTTKYANDRGNVWTWMRDLAIGESAPPLHDGRSNAYLMAKKYGIKITIKSRPDGDFVITRTE